MKLAEVIVVHSAGMKLSELAFLVGIRRPTLFLMESHSWKALKLKDDRSWRIEAPTIVVEEQPGFKVKIDPVALVQPTSFRASRELMLQIGTLAPCLFTWGIPGAYDFTNVIGSDLAVRGDLSGKVVRETLIDSHWKPYIAVAESGPELFRMLWQHFRGAQRTLHVVSMEGILPEEERIETISGGSGTLWNRHELNSEYVGMDLVEANRGGEYVSIWPSYCSSKVISRFLMAWNSGYGLQFRVEDSMVEESTWCALFGCGTMDFAMTCFVGDVESWLGDKFRFEALL